MKKEKVIPEDAWEEPDWCFKANTISETFYKDRNAAGVAISELLLDLINNDVLTARLLPRQFIITLLCSFDHDSIVQEQVTAL